jgi:hypothetical protein
MLILKHMVRASLRTAHRLLPLAALLTLPARAIEIRISAKALERTLQQQLFNGPDGRYYIRGDQHSGCFVYAEQPRVSFLQDRIVVHVHTRSRLGTSLRGACLGVGLTPEADVSVLPEAEGETIGFRDARVENLSASKELNFFLEPFLSHKLPQHMKLNAADLLRQLIARSAETTGYDLKLDQLKIHSMQILGDALVVDFDGQLSVH